MSTFPSLIWLDLHRPTYLWSAGAVIVLALAAAVAPFLRGQTELPRRHDWIWVLVIFAILVAGRWPTFFYNRELNPDESQFLAGARVLLLDPVFSRSIDGETSGPLSFFALWPAGFVFGWHSYLAARITALLLLTGEADLVQATQSPHFGRATTPGPYQQFFRRRFIANRQALKPELFLDSSGPSRLVIAGDPAFAHDLCFPELASVIRADYRPVGGVNGARLYRRIRPDHRRPTSTGRTAADPSF